MSTNTRERIRTAMAELMRTQGYGATTVKQVSELAGAPMGSLYHHFPQGKQQIAAEALRAAGAAYIQLLPLLMDPHEDLREAVTAAFTDAGEQMEQAGWINMCPVVTIAGEIADSEPALRAVAAEILDSWVVRGTAYFAHRGLDDTQARQFTLALLSALEGAFILSRTLHSTEPLRAAGQALAFQLVNDTV
ncbi:TetR/AcrR family transcriptional regulator [Nocardia sp. GCM10030253]|uniref:TetR/AcrR family transcriptional regulator n=1 Tax=Nocardia sp. GCM10030253 TaxID=3273404 RepID=UPI00363AB679